MSTVPKRPRAKAVDTVVHYADGAASAARAEKHRYVGRPLERVDGEAKVTGKAVFTAELAVPGLTYAALVCSTIARGRVTSVDGADASTVPGFVALLTHENMPRLARPEPGSQAGGEGFALSDLPYLQDDEVRWDGQPVAVVVADTLDDAEHAASLVRVEYELAAEPALSFDGEKRNAVVPESVLGEASEITIGDADAALEQAAVKVDHTYRTPKYNHHAIEPHATVAWWDEAGALTVYDTTQSVFRCKEALAQVFGMDGSKVRAIAAYVGGGFGGKAGLWSHTPLCAAAAKVVQRPVKLVLTREQVVRVVGGRTVSEQRVALGADRRGRLAGLIHEGLTAATTHGRYPEQFTFPARHLYKTPSLRLRQQVVNLDMVANTWMRAPGESIGSFALESALDELAHELALDPIELRRRNEPRKDPTEHTRFSRRKLVEAYRRGAEVFGWSRCRLGTVRARRDGPWQIGCGVATACYPYFRVEAKARVRISADGTVTIRAPANEMGMGTATVQIQHAAQRLGLPFDRVSFEYGDSALADTKIMGGGSSQTVSVIAAVDAAIDKALRALLKLAARHPDSPLAGLRYKDVEVRDGGLYRSGRSRARRERLRDPAKGGARRHRGRRYDRRAEGGRKILDGLLRCAILRSTRARTHRRDPHCALGRRIRLRPNLEPQDGREPTARRDRDGDRYGAHGGDAVRRAARPNRDALARRLSPARQSRCAAHRGAVPRRARQARRRRRSRHRRDRHHRSCGRGCQRRVQRYGQARARAADHARSADIGRD